MNQSEELVHSVVLDLEVFLDKKELMRKCLKVLDQQGLKPLEVDEEFIYEIYENQRWLYMSDVINGLYGLNTENSQMIGFGDSYYSCESFPDAYQIKDELVQIKESEKTPKTKFKFFSKG